MDKNAGHKGKILLPWNVDAEYIEIYNPTAAALNLTGWKLKDNGGEWTFPAGTALAPGAVMVVARNSVGFYNLFKRYPDLSGLTLSLSNTGLVIERVPAARDTNSRLDWLSNQTPGPGTVR